MLEYVCNVNTERHYKLNNTYQLMSPNLIHPRIFSYSNNTQSTLHSKHDNVI